MKYMRERLSEMRRKKKNIQRSEEEQKVRRRYKTKGEVKKNKSG